VALLVQHQLVMVATGTILFLALLLRLVAVAVQHRVMVRQAVRVVAQDSQEAVAT
jgi:hypothetical protein